MKVVVTGAGGFIGSYLVKSLVDRGYEVTALGRPVEKLKSVYKNNIRVLESDYSVKDLKRCFQGAHVVVHLAAQLMERDTDPYMLSKFYKANIMLVENVLRASLECGVKKVCQASSISVYSDSNSVPFKETELPVASNIYGVSKLAAENLAEYFRVHTGMDVFSLRFARVFGVGGRGGQLIMDSVSKASRGEAIMVYGEGKSAVDFIYVKDVVSAIEKAISSKQGGGIYNIGSGKASSVVEIANMVNKVFANSGNLQFDRSKKENGEIIYLDTKKAKERLGWKASWTLEKALRDIKDNYSI